MLFFILKVERLSFPTIYDMQKTKDVFFLKLTCNIGNLRDQIFLNQDGGSLFSIFLKFFYLSYHKKYIIFFLSIKFEYSIMKNEEIITN